MILEYSYIKASPFPVFSITFFPKMYFNIKACGFGHEIFTADRRRVMGQQTEKVTGKISPARQHMT